MSLKTKLSEDLKTAMKAKDAVRLGSVRVIKSEIDRAEQTEKGKVELPDAEIIKIIKKLIQSVKETTNLQAEIDVYESYLPKQLTEAEIRSVILVAKASGDLSSPKDMGKIMSFFKTNYDGLYDGKLVSKLVKEML